MVGGQLTKLHDRAQFWNVTGAERTAEYPCDVHAGTDWMTVLRGIDVAAPVPVTFRWVCQLKVAPYSYDWIDNRGRRSPRDLTPGAEFLELGQQMMSGTITDFAIDDHITGVATPAAQKFIGPITMSYVVHPSTAGRPGSRLPGSRLLVCLRIGGTGVARRMAREALLWGDLLMMRKQLLVLKECAERTARDTGASLT